MAIISNTITKRLSNNTQAADQFLQKLSPVLFWDMDKAQIDVDKHAASIIQRVLEFGTLDDWRLTRDFYGLDFVVECCQQLRTLDPVALSFVCAISDTKKRKLQMLSFQTITSNTLELLKKLAAMPELSNMRLVGDTALALQYGHQTRKLPQ